MTIENILLKVCKGAFVGAIAAGISAGAFYLFIRPTIIEIEYNEAWDKAIFKYADKNQDGIVTAEEGDEFAVDLLKDKGVMQMHGRLPRYNNGEKVPLETLTKWIKEYRPEK